ncbi:MAG TPA: hypothetical protein VFI65_20220, partial [Streptosporangiaceae bacterium]|nr:hypothetical protein [Streptosporangiaceae bacterium]
MNSGLAGLAGGFGTHRTAWRPVALAGAQNLAAAASWPVRRPEIGWAHRPWPVGLRAPLRGGYAAAAAGSVVGYSVDVSLDQRGPD